MTKFLRDGMRLAEIAEIDPDICTLLPRVATRTGERVRFVGVVQTGRAARYMFLPKGGWRADSDEAMKIGRLAMEATLRFLRSNKREGRRPEADGNAILELVNEIADDFLDHGIVDRREIVRGIDDGKPDWAATIAKNAPHIDSNGQLVFTTTRTRRLYDNSGSDLSDLHAFILGEIQSRHGWWLGMTPAMIPETETSFSDIHGSLCIVREVLAQSCSARTKRTAALLEAYILGGANTADGAYATGVSDFSAVWEWALGRIVRGQETCSWTKRFPRLFCETSEGRINIHGDIRPDIIVREGTHLRVVDAKYYEATGTHDIPGRDDIRKQQEYLRTLESVAGEGFTLSNHFVFPSEKTGEGWMSRIVEQPDYAGRATAIDCSYLSVEEVLKAAVTGRSVGTQRIFQEAVVMIGKPNGRSTSERSRVP